MLINELMQIGVISLAILGLIFAIIRRLRSGEREILLRRISELEAEREGLIEELWIYYEAGLVD